MSSSQLTFIFFRGVETTNQKMSLLGFGQIGRDGVDCFVLNAVVMISIMLGEHFTKILRTTGVVAIQLKTNNADSLRLTPS